jgi:hypothetical protein
MLEGEGLVGQPSGFDLARLADREGLEMDLLDRDLLVARSALPGDVQALLSEATHRSIPVEASHACVCTQ